MRRAFEPGAPTRSRASATLVGPPHRALAGSRPAARCRTACARRSSASCPYWMLVSDSKLQWMRYDLLSTIAFFGVAAQSDGTLATYGSGLARVVQQRDDQASSTPPTPAG